MSTTGIAVQWGSRQVTAQGVTFTPNELAFLIGVPLLWAVLLLFHPGGEDGGLILGQDKVTAWMVVHIGMMFFIPLFAAVVLLLLRGVEARAQIGRIALALRRLLQRLGGAARHGRRDSGR